MSAEGLHKRRVCCPNNDDGHGVQEVSGSASQCCDSHHGSVRTCRRNRMKDTSNQGESQKDYEYSPIPSIAKAHDN